MLGYLFKDSTTGKPCSAKTLNTIAYLVILTKITLSSATILGHTFATVAPADVQSFVMLLGVTTAGYAHRAMRKGVSK